MNSVLPCLEIPVNKYTFLKQIQKDSCKHQIILQANSKEARISSSN